MAYKATVPVNWCPNCKTVLSNEDAAGGVCERCGEAVVQKEKSQWMLKMSEYAEDLLTGLDDTNFKERVKLGQINWIGKSTGVELDVNIVGGGSFSVFTTCIETVYGITFFVIAPDGKLIKELMPRVENKEEVNAYILETSKKSSMDRTELNKGKTGVEIKGIKAINPINGKEVPIFLGDFVLGDYGTGAVMAVPSHDQRDFEYAKEHNLEMVEVISGGDTSVKAFEKHDYLGKGCKLVNSEEFTGMTVEEAKEAITNKLEKEGIARRVNNYKMRDWIFSRQRFWGEPIPMIYCDKCGWEPMDEKDLPLLLPDIAEYEPTDTGESPLAKIDSFVNTTCPKCGGPAKRETDTMPNWAGSSWYFLRFMDPHNDKEFASMDAMKYWNRVDWYNGGMEHTARHLLYARFWVQMLYNFGLVPKKEMIWTRVSHGMVLGDNNEKMSKSKGNVINPDDIVNDYGADTLRVYEMFMGDYEQDAPWSTDSLKGCKRFIDRVIRLKEELGKVSDNFDYILIDCPPSLGILTTNALAAANSVLIPVQCEYFALEGIMQLINTIMLAQRKVNPNLDIEGVLLTMFSNTNLGIEVIESIKGFFKERVYNTIIPRLVRLAEAPSHGKPILEYEPRNKGTIAYLNLAKEVIERNGTEKESPR